MPWEFCILGWKQLEGGKKQRVLFSPDDNGNMEVKLLDKPVVEGDPVDDLYTLSFLVVKGWKLIYDTGLCGWYYFQRQKGPTLNL